MLNFAGCSHIWAFAADSGLISLILLVACLSFFEVMTDSAVMWFSRLIRLIYVVDSSYFIVLCEVNLNTFSCNIFALLFISSVSGVVEYAMF